MSFLYPSFLFALFAIAVPIIIHLFNFRRYKKVHFSNVSFLQALQQETRKKSRIRQWLILLARILTVASLVLAFSQPYIPGKDQNAGVKGDKAVSIFIDNSFSMETQGNNGRLFDMAVEITEEIIRASSNTDKIQILTQDFEGRHQLFYTPEEALQLLEEVKISSFTHPLSDIAERQSDLLQRSEMKYHRAYIISDFQKSMTDFGNIKNDSSSRIQLVPLKPNNQSNLYIDSCWLLSPELALNRSINITVRIWNKSSSDLEDLVLNYEVDGEGKLPVSFSIGANSSVEIPINFIITEAGYHWGRIYIDDAEIIFDDDYYFSINLPEQLRILHLKGTNATGYIEKLFSNDEYFQIQNVVRGQLDYSSLPNYHFVILNELKEISSGMGSELKKFMEKGGSVFVVPSGQIDQQSYNNFFQQCSINGFNGIDTTNTKVGRIDKEQPFFLDVFESIPENMDVPKIKSIYRIGRGGLDNVILNTANGRKFFVSGKVGKGSIYQLGVPLNDSWSNFAKNILFVPVFVKAALQSVRSGDLYVTMREGNYSELNLDVSDGDRVARIRSLDDSYEFIPEQKSINQTTYLYFNNKVKKAGIYKVIMNDKQVGQLAFNYDRRESQPETYIGEELQQTYEENGLTQFSLLKTDKDMVKKQVTELDQGIRLWKLFIIFALVFIGCEILLARFMK